MLALANGIVFNCFCCFCWRENIDLVAANAGICVYLVLLKIDLSLLVGKAAITLQFFTPSKSNSNTLLLLGHEHDLSRLERGPLVSLNVIRDDGQEAEDADNLNQQLLAIVVLRLGGPLQESGHVLG